MHSTTSNQITLRGFATLEALGSVISRSKSFRFLTPIIEFLEATKGVMDACDFASEAGMVRPGKLSCPMKYSWFLIGAKHLYYVIFFFKKKTHPLKDVKK